MNADCPNCKDKITIFPEDGWSHCPWCNALIRLDLSIPSSPKVEAGKRERGQIVRNAKILRTYARQPASTSSSASQPPRAIPLATGTPVPPVTPAAQRTASPRGYARPPQRMNSASVPPTPRPSPAQMTRTQAREERAQIAQELAGLENQMRVLQGTVGQSVNPERTLPIITEMAMTAQSQVDLMRRDGLLQEQLANWERQDREQREREPQNYTSRTPEPKSPGAFGIAAVVAVLAMLGYSVYANVNWSTNVVLAMAGVGLAIALVGFLAGRN